jgi:hypothetical protein
MDGPVDVPAIRHVFAHSEDLVVVTTGVAADQAGLTIGLLILSKPPLDFVSEFAFGIAQRRTPSSLTLRATGTSPDGAGRDLDLEAVGGGGATAHRADFRFHLSLPDNLVQASLQLSWPSMGINDTAQIDLRLFRAAVERRT